MSEAPYINDRRKFRWRRDFNDLVRDPSGKVAEAKVYRLVGKGLAAWMIGENAHAIVGHETVLMVLFGWLIAPDLIKKWITMKLR